jgi:hypothetical protein
MQSRAEMRIRLAALSLVATAVACSSGSLDGGADGSGGAARGGSGGAPVTCAAAGSSGFAALSTGAGGTGGGSPAGSGGTAGAPSDIACPDSVGTATGGGRIVGDDGKELLASVTASVRISALNHATSGALTAVTMEADSDASTQWTWFVSIPGLPPDRINVGDRFELNVVARDCGLTLGPSLPCQTVALARCGSLAAFTSQQYAERGVSPPALGSWGIALQDAGTVCHFARALTDCGYDIHAVRVTAQDETLTLTPGETGSIAGLSVTLSGYGSPVCDGSGYFSLSGFRAP